MKNNIFHRACISPRGVLAWTFLALFLYSLLARHAPASTNPMRQAAWDMGTMLAVALLAAIFAAIEANYFIRGRNTPN
jgi:hypothetical protein